MAMELEAAMLFDPPENLKMFWNSPNVDVMVAATQFYWIFNRIYRNLKLSVFLKWRTFVIIMRYREALSTQSTTIYSAVSERLDENFIANARITICNSLGENRTVEYTRSHRLSLIIIFRTCSNLLREKFGKFFRTWKEITQKSIRISNEYRSVDNIHPNITYPQLHEMNMEDQINFIWKKLNIENEEQRNDIKNLVTNIISSSHQKQSTTIVNNSTKSTPILSPKMLRNIYRDSRNFPNRNKNNHHRRVSYQDQHLPLSDEGISQSPADDNTSQTSHIQIDERKDSQNISAKPIPLGHKKGRTSILLPRSSRRRGQSIQLSRRLTELHSPFSSSCSSLPITSTSLCSSVDERPTSSNSTNATTIPSTTTTTMVTTPSTSVSDDLQTMQLSTATISPTLSVTEIPDKTTTRSNIPLSTSRTTSLTSTPAIIPTSSPLVSPRNESNKDIHIPPKSMHASSPSSSIITAMRRSSLRNSSQFTTNTSNHHQLLPPHNINNNNNNNNSNNQSKITNNIQIIKPSLSQPESNGNYLSSKNISSSTSSTYEPIYKLLQSSQQPSLQDLMKSNVKVAVRMRPLNNRERCMYAQPVIKIRNNEVHVMEHNTEKSHCFVFDYCYDANDTRSPEQIKENPVGTGTAMGSQQMVFETLGIDVLRNAWLGYNTSIFAYGQTGSGKSYSMMGSPQDTGIIPRVCEALFYMIDRENQKLGTAVTTTATTTLTTSLSSGIEEEKGDHSGEGRNRSSHSHNNNNENHYNVEASYLEIYNETIRDLLNSNKVNLKVREHPTLGVFVENLSSCAVQSYSDINDLLTLGLQQRTVAATNMNEASSRSHSIFTITISRSVAIVTGVGNESSEESHVTTDISSRRVGRVNKLCLIDLAGSERAQSTGSTGIRLKEGASINKSLSTLGRCISALAKLSSNAAHEGRQNNSNNSSRRNSKATLTSSSVTTPSEFPGLNEPGLPPTAPSSHTRRPAILVPYRDSVLTSILRESLCGNAKTAMLATISPADNSLSETMSTLRYAQSAKQIQTKAVLLEDDNNSASATILSLKAEILALQSIISASQLMSSLKSPTPTSTLQELESAEVALHSQTALWETKVASMEKIKSKLHNHQIVATLAGEENQDTDSGSYGGSNETAAPPYIVSLSNDPQLHQAVKIYLSKGSILRVGRLPRPGETPQLPDEKLADLQLDGLGIEIEHCILDHDRCNDEVWMHVAPGAITYVNGKQSDPDGKDSEHSGEEDVDDNESVDSTKVARVVVSGNDSIMRDSGGRSAVTTTTTTRSEAAVHDDIDDDGVESGSFDTSLVTNTSQIDAAEAKKKFVCIDGYPSSIKLQSGDRLVFGACSHVFVYIYEQQNEINKKPTTTSGGHDDIQVTTSTSTSSSTSTTTVVVIPSYQQAMREVILGRIETDLERKRRLAAMVLSLSRGPYYRQLFEEKLIEALKTIREANTILMRLCPYSNIQFTTFLSTRLPEDVVPTISLRGLFEFNKISIRIGCYRNTNNSSSSSYCYREGDYSKNSSSRQKKSVGHSPSVFRAYSACKNAHHLSSSPSYFSMHKSYSISSTAAAAKKTNTDRRTESFDDIEDFNFNLNRIFEISLSDFYEGMLLLKSHFASLYPLCVFIEQVCNSFDSLSQSKYFGNLPAIIGDLHLLLVPPTTTFTTTSNTFPGDHLDDNNVDNSNPIINPDNSTTAAAANLTQTQTSIQLSENSELKKFSSETNLEIIPLSINMMSDLLESLNLNGQEFATLFYEYRDIDEMIDMQSDCRAYFKALDTLFLKTILNCFINYSDIEEWSVSSQHPSQQHKVVKREETSVTDHDLPYDNLFSNNSVESEFYRVNSFCDKSIRNPIRNLERGIIGRNYNNSNNSSQHVNWSDDELEEEEVEQVVGDHDITSGIQNMTNYDIMRAFEEVEEDEERQS